MGGVRKSQYRQPLTPKGIEKIEKGTLNWFDPEMFANFNTGTLEQYLDEKNAREGFEWDKWVWWKVIVAIVIGCLFALINQYVGLKVGMVVGGSWYILYLMGLVLRWSAPELNTAATASNGAAMICVGFVFTFPAILLLWKHDIGLVGGEHLITSVNPSVIAVAIAATSLSGILGVMYFIVFRRIWLVEDPLPTPGFEAMTKLLDMSHHLSRGSSTEAKKSIKLVGITIMGTMVFTFFRDFPLFRGTGLYAGEKISIFDRMFGGNIFNYGEIHQTYKSSNITHLSFAFIPIQFGIGWFMKFRTALLIFLGTAFTWFIVVPLVVLMKVPIYNGRVDGYLTADLASSAGLAASPAWAAYDIARLIAIGCILGGGITAIVKMIPVFFTVFKDMKNIGKPAGGVGSAKAAYYPKKGWYEWPSSHIKLLVIINFVGVAIIFTLGGFNFLYAIIFSAMLASCTFFLGAIAVKVMGETGTEPVSATSFIVLLFIIVVFLGIASVGRALGIGFLDLPKGEIAIMALIGTTVFGGAISMSGDVILNFKNGLYAGNRPYHLVKANTLGIPIGAVVAGVSAYILSYGLAIGELNLQAPQAFAFVIFTKAIISLEIQWPILIFGILLGVFLELLMGLGTAFGLGMYLPLGINAPMLMGGASRDLWEKYYLEPTVKRRGWGEAERTLKLMETYMIATGLMVGEALMGTVVALWLVIPLLWGGG
jgi:uncharacterized oligopeptide transporter (OPT) family protein